MPVSTPTRTALTAKQTEALLLYVKEGYTMHEVGELCGVTRAAIYGRLKPLLTPQLRAEHDEARSRRLDEQRWPGILELVKVGATKTRIRVVLGISPAQLNRALDLVDDATMRQWQTSLSRETVPRFTTTYKLECLRQAARLNGGTISYGSYERLQLSHPTWPSASSYLAKQRWNWWLRQADLTTCAVPEGIGRAKFSDAECAAAFRRVVEIVGPRRLITMAEYRRLRRPTDPRPETLSKRYGHGSWVQVIHRLHDQSP